MLAFFIISPLLFFLPLYYSLQTQQIFSVNKFIYILFFLGIISFLFLIKIIKNKTIKIPRYINSPLFLFSISFFVLSLLTSSFFSITPIESFFGNSSRHFGVFFLLVLVLIFLFLQFFNISKKEWIYGIFLPILGGGIVSSIWAISQMLGYSPVFGDILNTQALSERSFAGMGQPNFLAQTLIIPFFISLYISSRIQNTVLKIFCMIFSFLIFAFAIYATHSRAGLFGILLGLCILIGYILYKRYNNKSFLYGGIFLSFIFLISLWLIIFFFGNEIALFLENRGQSIASRYYFWNESLPLFTKYGIFGVGADLLQSYISPILSMEAFATENFSAIPDRTHTFILDFPLHFGIIPFLLFFTGFFLMIKKTLINTFLMHEKNEKNISFSIFLFAGIIGTFTSWMFGFPILVDSVLSLIALSYIFSRNNIYEKIKINSHIKIYLSLLFIFLSLFLFYTGYVIFQSEKSLFILTERNTRTLLSDEENKKHSDNILKTPYLSDNIITSIPFVSSNQQKKILEIGEKYHYNSLQWKETMIMKYSMEKNIHEARKYFLYTKYILGNHFPQQWMLLKSISPLHIFSSKDMKKFHQDIKNMIPKEYLNPKNNTPKIKKFWKHHRKIIEEIFKESL